MNNDYTLFTKRYNIKRINVTRSRDQTGRYSYEDAISSYYTDRNDTIDMEIFRNGFEELIRNDNVYSRIEAIEREEQWMRRTHPAINDAYHKYKMLLELYR